MKTYLIMLALIVGQRAVAQTKPAVQQDDRIFFYPDEPVRAALIKRELSLSPNPASSITKVHVTNMTDQALGSGYRMQVHSIDGRLCHQQPWSAGEQLDVSGLAEGIYIVSVRRENLLFTQKLMVRKK